MMAKRFFFSVVALFYCTLALAQSEWIDFDRTYYKIPTATDGIYRLNFTSLSSSGLNPNVIDPRNIRIFHRGEEVAIFVQGEADGKFDPNDFIDFYGKRNDATLDVKFYDDPSHLGNTMYNTHNDTTAFFLTLSPDTRGKRMARRQESNASIPLQANYQTIRQVVYFENYNLGQIYSPGVYLTDFEEGSGWMSAAITKTNPRTVVLADLGDVPNTGNVQLEIGLTGRSPSLHTSLISWARRCV